MIDPQESQPADLSERRRAVDIGHSCIVQAPAGSGKTELLIQRILALLAVVDRPEEVLAITFTRKAAGEMKSRLLESLDRARNDQPPAEQHARETWERARAVLARDRIKSWGLLENPTRLQLMTIDSFCSFLTRRMPWLSRFGDQPNVTDDPVELYRLAADRLVSHVDTGGVGQTAIEQLLRHLDNRLSLLRDLLVSMLGKRDQWLRHLVQHRSGEARQRLEAGLQAYVSAMLERADETLGRKLISELLELGRFAAAKLSVDHDEHPLLPLITDGELPKTDCRDLGKWLALAHLVLTGGGQARKSVDKRLGFPAGKDPQAVAMKSRILELLSTIDPEGPVIDCLETLRGLPDAGYSEEQWVVLEALIELLPLAVVELQQVFLSFGQVDFVEIAGAAHAALGRVDEPEDLLLQMDSRFRHVLIDEFQDTSYAQYGLLQLLTSGWVPDDGRTLFLVGDPMQSIYRFREADVGLYLRVCNNGWGDLSLQRVTLTANFRSQARLVEWANSTFAGLFPQQEDEVLGAVTFSAASSIRAGQDGPAVTVHGFVDRQDEEEASRVVQIVQQARAEDPDASIAVLVRSRTHLTEIVRKFRASGLRFQAQDVDALTDRSVVQDLLALTRALLHPADRISWLSVLRAPWCGLVVNDLLALCGSNAKATVWQLLNRPEEQQEMFERISCDGRQRLDRVLPVLERALNQKGRIKLRPLVETTWLRLGGPACVGEADLADAGQVFALLEELDAGGDLERLEYLEERLKKLFAAPDPQAGPELQVMTIHKAKGLEFDTVIIPGLGRGVRPRERSLLRWLEHPDFELILAPIPPMNDVAQGQTYKAVGQLLQDKDNLETVRLLYVAATRAKSRLHLLGHVSQNSDGEYSPGNGSLLSVAWPTLTREFTIPLSVPEGRSPNSAEPLFLRRLPVDWTIPVMPAGLQGLSQVASRASDGGHTRNNAGGSRYIDEGRVVGVMVHGWLERIALQGLTLWDDINVSSLKETVSLNLGKQGIPSTRVEDCCTKVLSCLENTLQSERGRWLLSAHSEAGCELALSGLIDGQLYHASIDRTFVDDCGVRWIVDYKTSQPDQGVSADYFVSTEMDRYCSQLQTYARMFGQLEPQRMIRTALYFPAFDGWHEVEY